jgi:hypothetical protein
MTIAAKLSRKLYETFGDEAAETMIDWMQDVDARRAESRQLADLAFDRQDARFGERLALLRDEMRAEMGIFRDEMRAEMAAFRGEMRAEMAALRDDMRTELHTEIAKLADRIDARYTDLFKWSFAFWIGSTVTLMLGMATILRITR